MTVLPSHFIGKSLQRFLVGNIANKVVALLLVYHANIGSSLPELFCDAAPDALCATRYDYYFILEVHHCFSLLNLNI